MILAILFALLILATLAGVWYARTRRPKPLPPPVAPTEPLFVARRIEPGHHYRMKLPDRLKLEHHR